MKKLVVILGVAALAGNMVATQPPDHLVPICHNGRIITVDVASVPAHQAHGDTLDVCEGQEGDT